MFFIYLTFDFVDFILMIIFYNIILSMKNFWDTLLLDRVAHMLEIIQSSNDGHNDPEII